MKDALYLLNSMRMPYWHPEALLTLSEYPVLAIILTLTPTLTLIIPVVATFGGTARGVRSQFSYNSVATLPQPLPLRHTLYSAPWHIPTP